jgi:RNA polymerase sigma-70 factor (ECF subfamily)
VARGRQRHRPVRGPLVAPRTWVYGILVNIARTRAKAESRTLPLPAEAGEVPSREPSPLELVEDRETRDVIDAAIEALPATQRTVIVLRDVQGWSSPEVCGLLDLTSDNQRVILHRARARVRAAIEAHRAIDRETRAA